MDIKLIEQECTNLDALMNKDCLVNLRLLFICYKWSSNSHEIVLKLKQQLSNHVNNIIVEYEKFLDKSLHFYDQLSSLSNAIQYTRKRRLELEDNINKNDD